MEKKEERDHFRNATVEKAVRAANGIIMEASDGSEEETNYLTARVAENLMETALHPFSAAILKKDMEDQNTGKLG